ncbi:MAG: hypothetical protein FWE34_06735 [Defluviitaleaceae bacterium]|nr:hypothetical protein [Defluviitaleaceae bacterium]
MNTERTKNVLIALLSVIAISLSALIFATEGRYTLSAGQEADIRAVLERDNIHLRDGMVIPRDFQPLRQMEMQRYGYELEELATRFFGDDGFILDAMEMEYKYTHPNNDDGAMMVYSTWTNVVSFFMPQGASNEAFALMQNERGAEILATHFTENLLGMSPSIQHYSTTLSYHGIWIIDFFAVYRGFVLQNDHIRVHVSENGIEIIEYSRVKHSGFIGDARGIFPPNEALMALANHMRLNRGAEGAITINDMRLSYFLTEEGGHSIGVPAYVFSVYMGGMMRFNAIFNAYTNELLHFETAP